MLLLLMLMLIPTVMLSAVVDGLASFTIGRHVRWTAGKIDVYPPCVLFGCILQTQLLTDLFDARFYFLDMIDRVVPFTDDTIFQMPHHQLLASVPISSIQTQIVYSHMEMVLAMALRIFDALF